MRILSIENSCSSNAQHHLDGLAACVRGYVPTVHSPGGIHASAGFGRLTLAEGREVK